MRFIGERKKFFSLKPVIFPALLKNIAIGKASFNFATFCHKNIKLENLFCRNFVGRKNLKVMIKLKVIENKETEREKV